MSEATNQTFSTGRRRFPSLFGNKGEFKNRVNFDLLGIEDRDP
jgi:hypothetical protein